MLVDQGSKNKTIYRCKVCSHHMNFILSLTNQCVCENLFCNQHLPPEKHGCSFDYRRHFQAQLEKNNPMIEAPKLENRI